MAPFLCGFVAAALAVIISIPLVVLGDNYANDTVLLALASILATGFVMCFCTTRKPGHCIHCGYDLRCSLNTGRCPECGLSLSKLMNAA